MIGTFINKTKTPTMLTKVRLPPELANFKGEYAIRLSKGQIVKPGKTARIK